MLPRVSANLLSGLIETLAAAPFNGKADLPVLADELHLEADELFPVAEALQMFRFAEIEGGDIKLTDIGKQFAELGTDDRKKLFQRQLCPMFRSPHISAVCCRSAPITWRRKAAFSTNWKIT